ncbi:MAG: hypothetical protein PUB96_08615 [Helicobacteraceae bacterium]|nr:hypothetical protein [Helicobacteraceae bacterium]
MLDLKNFYKSLDKKRKGDYKKSGQNLQRLFRQNTSAKKAKES